MSERTAPEEIGGDGNSTRRGGRRRRAAVLPVSGIVLLLAVPMGMGLEAQQTELGFERPRAENLQGSQPDFLFEQPAISLGLRLGLLQSRGESDIFDFFSEELTLDSENFDGFALQADLGAQITERLEGVLSVGHSRASQRSEFRDWEDESGLPIEQNTHLRTTPITLSLKGYLSPRGHSVGRFVWVPRSFAPYVGAGGGAIQYQLVQEGEFVDFEDLMIFEDRFSSAGWGGTFHVMAGGDIRLNPRLLLTGDARYRWASGDLGSDFLSFDPIDLSGLKATVGLTVRF